jgi:hypothetical protein
MSSRSVRPYSNYRGGSPYVPRHAPAAEGPDGMRIGGYVVLAMGIWRLVEYWVLSIWLDTGSSLSSATGWAAFYVVLGIAMLQGSEAARKTVLVITFLAMLLIGGAIAGLFAAGFGHLWPILAASAAATVGIFLLVLSRQPSLTYVSVSLVAIVAGWAGSVLAAILLAGTLDFTTLRLIREWSSPERSFANADAGLDLRVPPRWVALRADNPLAAKGGDKVFVTLAHTEVIAFALLLRETRRHESLDYFLNALGKEEDESEATGVREIARSDGMLGQTPLRRLKTSSKRDGTTTLSLYSAWQDGDVYYHILLIGPGILSKRLDEELATLEKSVSFSAPVNAFLKDDAPRIRAACPLLSEKALISLTHVVRRGAAPETYCREGYRLALKGQPLIDASSAEHMRSLMQALFAAIPKARLGRFGSYVERLVANQPTSREDDREMMETARAAMAGLAPATQESLRGFFVMAIEMGQFELGQLNPELRRDAR